MIHDDALDACLDEIALGTVMHICSSEPANYAAVAGVSLGTKSTPTFTGPVNGDVSGRKLTVDAISNGSVTSTGTASHFALVDASRLLVAGPLAASQGVTSGNAWSLAAFDIELPDPT
jgi:hypothetical protein